MIASDEIAIDVILTKQSAFQVSVEPKNEVIYIQPLAAFAFQITSNAKICFHLR